LIIAQPPTVLEKLVPDMLDLLSLYVIPLLIFSDFSRNISWCGPFVLGNEVTCLGWQGDVVVSTVHRMVSQPDMDAVGIFFSWWMIRRRRLRRQSNVCIGNLSRFFFVSSLTFLDALRCSLSWQQCHLDLIPQFRHLVYLLHAERV
jgi:hypothetical protein